MRYLDLLRKQFNNQVDISEKRPGIFQLFAPLYHEDGDMVDIFLERASVPDLVRVCDYGMTLMRLSYEFEIDTPNKRRIFQRILAENSIEEDDGNLYLEAKADALYPSILQFAQGLAKVSNMQLYKREVVRSLFYEMLDEFVVASLAQYHPQKEVLPLPDREELEVDYMFNSSPRPVYLFGVRDSAKARLVTISCQAFLLAHISFRSFVVHEDFTGLGKKDQSIITSASDKQFVSFDDFQQHGQQFLERELELARA